MGDMPEKHIMKKRGLHGANQTSAEMKMLQISRRAEGLRVSQEPPAITTYTADRKRA